VFRCYHLPLMTSASLAAAGNSGILIAMRPAGGGPSLLGVPIEIYNHLLDFLPCIFDVWALSGAIRTTTGTCLLKC